MKVEGPWPGGQRPALQLRPPSPFQAITHSKPSCPVMVDSLEYPLGMACSSWAHEFFLVSCSPIQDWPRKRYGETELSGQIVRVIVVVFGTKRGRGPGP